MAKREMGIIVQREDGALIVIPSGRTLALGYGRLHVRGPSGKDIAVFEVGRWRFGALCDRNEVIVAPRSESTP